MTIDAAIPLATFTIAGTGPYPFTWPYAAGTIAVAVLTDEGWTDLSALQATISPEASAAGGAVTLQPAVVTQYAGRPMHIRRSTPREQGWAGLVGSREKGLEAALDQLALQMQEIGAASDRSLRVLGTEVPPADLEAGRAVVWDGTRFVGGPNADDLAHAEEYAERAEAAAAGISSAVYGVKHFATTDFALANGRGPYALDFDPLAGEYLDVELDGQSVYADQHWRVVPMASPTGWGIELLDDTPTGHQLAYSFRGIRNTTLGLPDLITNNPGDVYTRDTPLTIESGTRIPHKLKLNWTGPAHTVPLILGEGVYLDQFELLTSAPGVNFYSPKGFQGRTFKWTSTIESATSVFTAHPEDLCFEQMEFDNVGRGLVLSGEPVGNPAWVPYVTISGVRYKNPDFDPDAWTRPGGGWIGRMHLRGYFRSLWFKYMEEFRFGEIDFGRKMTGALGDPGNNGILTTGAKDISIIKAIIANAPEHAVRGAGEWAQKKSEILRFGSLTVIEPGESGIKINGNRDILFGEEKQKTSYTGIHIDDYELVGNFLAGGQNSDALRLTGADGAFFGKVKVKKAEGAERACQDVVSLDFTTGLTIGHLQSEDHSGVAIACRGDMDGEAPGDVTDCTFGRVVAKGGNHLLLADMKGSGAYATTYGSVGNIRIMDGVFNHGGDLARYVTGTTVSAPCYIAGTVADGASDVISTWPAGDLVTDIRLTKGASRSGVLLPGITPEDFGADPTGATDSTAAIIAWMEHGGDLYANGTYLIDGAGADAGGAYARLLTDVNVVCGPDCVFVAGEDLDNDVLRWTAQASVWAAGSRPKIKWQGGTIDQRLQRNSTVAPNYASYPAANPGISVTTDGLSVLGHVLNVGDGLYYYGTDGVHISGLRTIAGNHWETAGGDSGVYVSGSKFTLIENSVFKANRDCGIYLSELPGATGETAGALRIVTKCYFDACHWGAAAKRAPGQVIFTANISDNTPQFLVVQGLTGTTGEGHIISDNIGRRAWQVARVDDVAGAKAHGNISIDHGCVLADGSAPTLVFNTYNCVVRVQGAIDSDIYDNTLVSLNGVVSGLGWNFEAVRLNKGLYPSGSERLANNNRVVGNRALAGTLVVTERTGEVTNGRYRDNRGTAAMTTLVSLDTGNGSVDFDAVVAWSTSTNTVTGTTLTTDMKTATVRGSRFERSGDRMEIEAAGVFTGASGTKQLFLVIGGTTHTFTASASGATGDWRLAGSLIFTGGSVRYALTLTTEAGQVQAGVGAASVTASADWSITVRGKLSATGDSITCTQLWVG